MAICWVVAVMGLAICATKGRADLDDRTAPMAGLVTAFVFAVQMINFPAGVGLGRRIVVRMSGGGH